jgi:hypothetical protein
MAEREWYIGTVGPFFMDTDDPLFLDERQMLTRQELDVAGDVINFIHDSDEQNPPDEDTELLLIDLSVVMGATQLSFKKISWANLKSALIADLPGLTQDVTVVTDIGPPQVTSVLHFTDGLLTSIT